MITIRHTRDDGTLVDGSCRGDGVYDLLHKLHPHWTYKRSLGRIGLINSADRPAKKWMIDQAAAALRSVGHDVTVDIDDTPTRTVAEIEAGRAAAAQDRAERFGVKSRRLVAEADARRAEADRITEGYAGTPILIGHHSEARHRRDMERADAYTRKSIELRDKAKHYGRRAAAAASYQGAQEDLATTLRRVQRLEAEEKRLQRLLAAGGSVAAHLDEVREQLAHWRAHVERAEEAGAKVWSRADFAPGDWARTRHGWEQVVRVNARTLTVDVAPGWNNKLPYDKVTGRMSAAEMAESRASHTDS